MASVMTSHCRSSTTSPAVNFPLRVLVRTRARPVSVPFSSRASSYTASRSAVLRVMVDLVLSCHLTVTLRVTLSSATTTPVQLSYPTRCCVIPTPIKLVLLRAASARVIGLPAGVPLPSFRGVPLTPLVRCTRTVVSVRSSAKAAERTSADSLSCSRWSRSCMRCRAFSSDMQSTSSASCIASSCASSMSVGASVSLISSASSTSTVVRLVVRWSLTTHTRSSPASIALASRAARDV